MISRKPPIIYFDQLEKFLPADLYYDFVCQMMIELYLFVCPHYPRWWDPGVIQRQADGEGGARSPLE